MHINFYSMKKLLQKNNSFLLLFTFWILLACLILIKFTDKEILFFINQKHNLFLDYTMTVLSAYGRGESVTILFLSLLIFKQYREKKYILSTSIFGIFVPLIVFLSKDFFNRTRPIGEYGESQIHHVTWLTNLVNNSFPSGHTMGAFGMALFLNHFLPYQNKYISTFLFLLALGCGYSRIYLGQHYFSDVLAGSLFGVFFGIIILWCVEHFSNPKLNNGKKNNSNDSGTSRSKPISA